MKEKNKKSSVFDLIAPVYGLFYNIQRKNFNNVLNKAESTLKLSEYKNIIDIGCGTGAFCSVLHERGLQVTGIDPSQEMLDVAIKKTENKSINFIKANVIEGLPFENKSFDVSIASFVAHGLNQSERKIMYSEMSRITSSLVIIDDYNKNRDTFTNIIERLEGGDYFNFIKIAETEMKLNFKNVQIINVTKRAALYICEP
ncbi:MAG: class I SAM-dependent methyltransferase [Sedimentibacter sp.]